MRQEDERGGRGRQEGKETSSRGIFVMFPALNQGRVLVRQRGERPGREEGGRVTQKKGKVINGGMGRLHGWRTSG